MMKKMLALLLAAAAALSVAACGNTANETDKKDPAQSENTQIPNPWTEYDSLEEAEKAAGFSIGDPALFGNTATAFRVLSTDGGKMIEVEFENAEGETFAIRKAPGSGDISGDYTKYSSEETVVLDDQALTVKGEGDKKFLAIWTDAEYSYSVFSREGASEEALLQSAAVMLEPAEMGGVQIPNPWSDYDTLADAEKAAGFSLVLPADIFDGKEAAYRVLDADKPTLEVILFNGEGEEEMRIRKAQVDEDISGDYNVYETVKTAQVNGNTVTLSGAGDTVSLAVWSRATGERYSVSASVPVSEETMLSLVAAVS